MRNNIALDDAAKTRVIAIMKDALAGVVVQEELDSWPVQGPPGPLMTPSRLGL